ncbi:MAG TPA: phosphoglycerate dehydrogenase [Acidiferrobacterales bacterium]|nr:phosphoglycerate dehydrogenase [Acidiferrobacterales bacterium]
MFNVLMLNSISPLGLEKLPKDKFKVAADITNPDAVLLRSFNMHEMEIPKNLKAVGRAGAGVNNIPVAKMSALGIPVFNAPGANANAVKELVAAGLLLASRHICQAWDFARHLSGSDAEISKAVEAGKKDYAGFELPGRTLGVIGLGAVGRSVANIGIALGMKVVGFDPGLTVEGAWQLSSDVKKAASVDELLRNVDFVSFHVPLMDSTRNMINAERLKQMRDGVTILNFAREGIVNDEAVGAAIKAGKVYAYVCDFPTNLLKNHERVITLPHLGASTKEAEENCAVMVAEQVRDFLENGNIRNAVNFPEVVVPRESNYRLAVANANVPNMLGQISTAMAEAGLNIHDMVNKSRGELAYTIVDLDSPLPEQVRSRIAAIKGVMSARII